MKEQTKTLAKVNGQSIVVIENGNEYVPVTPICDALGIASNKQIEKIKEHPIFGSTHTLRVSVGADGKGREMFCMEYKWVFGWLATIDPRNVKPEAAEAVIKYQVECYTILFNHFTEQKDFLKAKQQLTGELIEEYQSIQSEFKNAKDRLAETKKRLNQAKDFTIEQWKENNRQLTIQYPEPINAEEN